MVKTQPAQILYIVAVSDDPVGTRGVVVGAGPQGGHSRAGAMKKPNTENKQGSVGKAELRRQSQSSVPLLHVSAFQRVERW